MTTAERLLAARKLDETRAARFASRKRVNQLVNPLYRQHNAPSNSVIFR